MTTSDWDQFYIQFIREAEVPVRGESKSGSYDINKFSNDGAKFFRKIIESGIKYSILVKSTLLYYKTRNQYQVTINNYIVNGLWRSDYDALLSSGEDGTIEQHIQKTIDDGKGFSRFKRG